MTFSSLNEGFIYQDSGTEGYMAFYVHQPRRGSWGCFMLRYVHTESIEGNTKISIKMPKQTQFTGKRNSLIHSSVAIHLAPASTAWPQRQALKEPSQEITASTRCSALQNHGLSLGDFQHHMWAATMAGADPG